MNDVGREIKRLREAKNWSQAQLAVYAGSSQPTVNQIETGKRNPSTATLQKLAGALEVPISELFPKGEALLSSEPTFNDVLGDEQRVDDAEKLRIYKHDELRQIAYAVSPSGLPTLPPGVSPQDAVEFAARELLELSMSFERAWEALPRVDELLVKEAEQWADRVRGIRIDRARREGSANNETA